MNPDHTTIPVPEEFCYRCGFAPCMWLFATNAQPCADSAHPQTLETIADAAFAAAYTRVKEETGLPHSDIVAALRTAWSTW